MKEGDVRTGIYFAHRSALIEYATPILGSREAAEDVVQDAYLRFSPAATHIASPEKALAYLYRIVRNLAFDILKHRKIEKREAGESAPFWAKSRAEATPEDALLYHDQIRLVSQVLETLPTKVRVAVEMHRFGGFTLQEVADHLGISVALAHRYVRSAMLKIAARIEPH